jgi:hypothetical protein
MDNQEAEMSLFDIIKLFALLLFVETLLLIKDYTRIREFF